MDAAPTKSFVPIVEEAIAGDAGGRWQLDGGRKPGEAWITADPRGEEVPEQGWKLHVSATAESAGDVLRRVLPVLVETRCAFKLAGSAFAVDCLNEGEGGLSQIGKFVTVYPQDDEQAVRLAVALDAATRDLAGPRVPSDRPLRPGSLVHYRYGGFTERLAYTSSGDAVPTIRSDDGSWVPDPRQERYDKPAWVEDPFEAAGVAAGEPSRAVAGRYLLVAAIHRSPRGTTHVAVDLEELETVVVKQAGRDARAMPGLGDARDQLRWEAEVLRRLAPDPRFPRVVDLVEHGVDLFLVQERLEGETLGRMVAGLAVSGRLCTRTQLIAWGRELAAAIGHLHAAGLVFRDLSPGNVIVGPDARLRLIDFELAAAIGTPNNGEAVGTEGYASPQQLRGEDPTPLDDVYSLGAMLSLLATGTDQVFVEERQLFLKRPLTLLNPALGSDLAAVIDRSLDPDPARRYGDAAEFERALAALPDAPETATAPGAPVGDRGRCAELAAEIGAQLAAWTLHETRAAGPAPPETLEAGMDLAGALLALVALDPESISDGMEAVRAGARRLAAMPRTGTAGLYLGEGGVAVALARAASWSGDAEIVAASAARAAHLASLTPHGIDLFGGEAGALRAHLLILEELSDPAALKAAVACGDRLLAGAEEAGEGRLRWRSRPDPGEAEGALHVGYAHGSAGIADVLLDLAAVSGEARYLHAAVAGGRWVEDQARPALRDGSGVAWPERQGGEVSPAIWCRGSTGIGRLLLRLGARGDEIAAEQAQRAAQTVTLGGRFLGPTSCHGLAGSVEFLLDVHAATGEPAWLEAADSLAALLETFRTDDGGWWSDSGKPLGFDLLTGRAGVAIGLLRLAAPGAVTPLLTPQRAGAGRMVATERSAALSNGRSSRASASGSGPLVALMRRGWRPICYVMPTAPQRRSSGCSRLIASRTSAASRCIWSTGRSTPRGRPRPSPPARSSRSSTPTRPPSRLSGR